MEEKEAANSGASLFGRSFELMDSDPLEEIFALNLGDFISEHLISDDLAKKIATGSHDKVANLKNQLKELVDIYSLDKTLCVLGFNSQEDYIIYNSIAKTISQMLDVDACHVYLSNEFAMGLNVDDMDLILVGSSVNFEDDAYKYNIGYNLDKESIVQKAYNERVIIEAKNLDKNPLFNPIKELNEDKVKLYTAIPMNNNAYKVGVIVIQSYKDEAFKNEYLDLVHSIARLFATSMSLQKILEESQELLADDNAEASELQHMRAELTALIGDLGDNQETFIKALAHAVDVKGQYNVAHSENTANLSKKLATELGLNEKTKDLIYYAGLLSNIGKIALPEELFSNKGKLSKEDWDKLKTYSNIGVNILMKINFLSEVVPYICYHKERYDGSGEPEGLARMSIPLGSRIIAVADAYSAMTSDRAFRKAMTKEQALAIMKQEAGVKWDPIIIDALYDVLNNN